MAHRLLLRLLPNRPESRHRVNLTHELRFTRNHPRNPIDMTGGKALFDLPWLPLYRLQRGLYSLEGLGRDRTPMSGLKALHPGKLALFGILSLADLVLTQRLVHASGGQIYESNPLASAWLELYGWAGLAIFKVLAMILVGGVALYISIHRPRAAGKVLGFACLATGVVVVYSCYLVGFLGTPTNGAKAADVQRAEAQSRLLDREIHREREYAFLLDQLVQDLIANRCTLAEGVERLAQSSKARDPRWIELLQKNYPHHSSAESLALHLGYHTLVQVHNDPDHQDRLAEKLEDDYQASFGDPINFHLNCTPDGGAPSLLASTKSHKIP